MPTKSVLIIGGSGFVGTHLALRLREEHKVFTTYSSHPVRVPGVTVVPMAVDDRSWIKQVIQLAKPDVIVYCPGETERVDAAPGLQELENIHSKGITNVLSCADMLQPRLIYLSTAYVFDGERGNYREGDSTVPTTALGKVKASAENMIRSRAFHSLIIRSSPLLGRGSGKRLSLLDRLRKGLDRGKPLELPSSEVHSFAPVEGLVELVHELIQRPGLKSKTLHYGGLTKLSFSELGKTFARRFGFDPALIVPTVSKTALDFSLNSSHAIELLQIQPLLLEESFDLLEKNLVPLP